MNASAEFAASFFFDERLLDFDATAFSFVCFVLAIRADAPSFVDDVPDDILDDCFTALIIIESFQRFFLRKCHHIRQALRQKCDQFSKKRLRHKRSILNLCNKLGLHSHASTKRRAHTTSHNHPRSQKVNMRIVSANSSVSKWEN